MSNIETKIMNDTVKQIRSLIEKRMLDRLKMQQAITTAPLDNLPQNIMTMREEEAAKIRAVIQEQTELLTFIDVLFPNSNS